MNTTVQTRAAPKIRGAPRIASWEVWGTTAALVLPYEIHPAGYRQAIEILRGHLEAFDLSCSRFRPDSELSVLNSRAAQTPFPASPLFLDALEAATRGAEVTGGLVDPTVGTALDLIGYDRDFASIAPNGPALVLSAVPVPGWKCLTVDRGAGTVSLRRGIKLDLGATAKALCADRAAGAISGEVGYGVLVSIGGDIATAGDPPEGGWTIRIAEDHCHPLDGPGPAVAIREGGLAASTTTVRRWQRGGTAIHHLIDPATSRPADEHWRTATVAAASCLDANIASAAAILQGPRAEDWLAAQGLAARLVSCDGSVTAVGGWPSDQTDPAQTEGPL